VEKREQIDRARQTLESAATVLRENGFKSEAESVEIVLAALAAAERENERMVRLWPEVYGRGHVLNRSERYSGDPYWTADGDCRQYASKADAVAAVLDVLEARAAALPGEGVTDA
jgi:hypothetical protein